MKGKIKNPDTGRWVSITGKIGKRIKMERLRKKKGKSLKGKRRKSSRSSRRRKGGRKSRKSQSRKSQSRKGRKKSRASNRKSRKPKKSKNPKRKRSPIRKRKIIALDGSSKKYPGIIPSRDKKYPIPMNLMQDEINFDLLEPRYYKIHDNNFYFIVRPVDVFDEPIASGVDWLEKQYKEDKFRPLFNLEILKYDDPSKQDTSTILYFDTHFKDTHWNGHTAFKFDFKTIEKLYNAQRDFDPDLPDFHKEVEKLFKAKNEDYKKFMKILKKANKKPIEPSLVV